MGKNSITLLAITGAGINELQEIQSMLGVLYKDVVKKPMRAATHVSS
ncbi:hypothetical protein [Paenibacillus brasilensis]|uniref:Uncharacterized protein n=1 Tax=Paenibacillus brasilensis TaxID=128574 RepID=A0ABU0L0P8_9BACL|nr:hypothetical protein [Paenibacillus brasilensis]MDQ0495260.1 hypothetical protein [Paenibacillus brasilensis]